MYSQLSKMTRASLRFLSCVRRIHLSQVKYFDKEIRIYLDVTQSRLVANALADRIKSELKEANLIVTKTDKLTESPQVPFTIMIDDQTMREGIIKLKYFKPRVTEEVHVTLLKDKLIKLM